jgi:hypothetical protein
MTPDDPRVTKLTKVPVGDMLVDFRLALIEVARVTALGNAKYGEPGSWRSVPDFERVYFNAKARHAISALVEPEDEESGLPHLAHEAWNALALLQHRLEAEEG